MKKIISILLVAMLLLTSCAKDTKQTDATPVASKDNYRNYYEIYVGGYCDSNGDGVGDLKGLTSKLDYLNDGDPKTKDDLGVSGIWLMPINLSPSYHKYDVTDYYSIDPQYGTMADFEEFLKEAHKRGIKVIMDLVINHSSTQNEWFKSGAESVGKYGDSAFDKSSPNYNKYAEYYNFKKNVEDDKYYSIGNDYSYEAQFWDQMPDLNLDSDLVKAEVQKICKFWLDKGVDGFRLDAVIHYFTGDTEKNVKFMSWLMAELKKIKPDVYVVGEAWTSQDEILDTYKSGITSLFNYPMSNADGAFIQAAINYKGAKLARLLSQYQKDMKAANPEAIDAPFLTNHDNGRSAGSLLRDPKLEKMAASLYLLAPGSPFIYYGEEIGMVGAGIDENKRQPMVWSSKDKTGMAQPVAGSTNDEVLEKGVKEQLEDKDSLLSFYKQVIRLKDSNPELARGTVTALDLDKEEICAYTCTYKDSKLVVIHNTGDKEDTIKLSNKVFKDVSIRGSLTADKGSVKLSGNKLTMPNHSTVVLKVKK